MKIRNLLLASTSMLLVTAAFGAELTTAQLVEVTKTALDNYGAANPEHAPHIVGFKTWKSTEDGKVKIYINHGGMNMEANYTCHIHETGSECHAQ